MADDDAPVWANPVTVTSGWQPVTDDTPPWAKKDEKKKKPDIGYLGAAGAGTKSGATFGFSDELSGLSAASGAEGFTPYGLAEPAIGALRLLYERMRGEKGPATEAYIKRRDEERQKLETAREQYPWTTGVSEFAGGAAIPLPGGAWAAGGRTLGRRMLGYGLQGAFAGGLTGAGEAETTDQVIPSMLTGAGLGFGAGSVVGPAIGGIVHGLKENPVSKWFNPEAAAGRRMNYAGATAATSERVAPGALPERRLLPTETPPGAMPVDYLGDPGRAQLKWASRTSPEAEGIIGKETSERVAGQFDRLRDMVRSNFGITDNAMDQLALKAQAARQNSPLYKLAEFEGNGRMVSRELNDIAQSPAVQSIMPEVIPSLQNRAVGMGQQFNEQGAYRSLEFWDQVQRKLQDQITAAERAGKPEFAREYRLVKDRLLDEMDRLVPTFKDARGSAASFFGKGDAIEAGAEFITNHKITSAQTVNAMRNMTPEEQQLFRNSAINQFMHDMSRVTESHDLWKRIDQNPAIREKLQLVFGQQGYRQLEAMGRVERIMHMAHTSATGGSDTFKNFMVGGLLGGAGIGADLYNQSGIGGAGTVIGGLALGARHINRAANVQIANRLADMLTSNDPARLQRAIQAVASSNTAMDMIRNFTAPAFARGVGGAAARGGTQ